MEITEMTITQGLKRLKLISKQIESNTKSIEKYSASLSNERLVFGSEEAQKKEVASLVQSNKDLIEIYIKIKNSIDYTNLHTQVPNTDRMISSQITNKRVTGAMRESTLEALSTDKAFMRINRRADEKIEVVPFFDEAAKNKMLKEHYEEMSEIDGVLEVLNATTKLMTP